MEEREFELLGEVQETHWIWRGRKAAMRAVIESQIRHPHHLSIADVGAGCGGNFEMLSQYGHVIGLEPSEKAIAIARSKYPNTEIRSWKFPEKISNTFDLVLASEVLEHIENDREAVDWIYAQLKPGGYALITVPAHRYLWTQMDDVVHHVRRYSKQELKSLFTGFEVVRLSYYNFFLYPLKLGLVLYDRILRRVRPAQTKQSFNELPPRLINSLLTQISTLEASLLRNISYPCGPSLIMLAKKI